ncbi:hypothetical protein HKX48_003599 [Thoreauomyces humboldtii]|nr:hypothetical protein HKX48_003599 [Thoreauomyces humboldtii]
MHNRDYIMPYDIDLLQKAAVLPGLSRDPRWDVRDSTLDLIRELFDDVATDSSSRELALEFALASKLPDLAITLIADPEPFVRSTCLTAMKSIAMNLRGHIYLSSTGLDHQLVQHILKTTLLDNEPLVRRSAIELLHYLVCTPRADTILFNLEHQALDASTMTRLMADVDAEVRVGAVRLLSALFSVPDDQGDPAWFLEVGGDDLISAAIVDDSRIVRQETHRVIAEQLLPATDGLAEKGSKRSRAPRMDALVGLLGKLDLERMRRECEPEHLYQEVLDVDESILTERKERGEGNNVLACYDC